MIDNLMEYELQQLQKECKPRLSDNQLYFVKLAMANYAVAATMHDSVAKEAEEICLTQDD